MSNTLKVKRGTNLSNAGTPAAGELLYKSDTNQLFVGDGSTAATGLSPIGGSASGDIEGVTAGNGLTGGGTSGTVTVNVGAGTGIDVAADAISVDVSDFMSNGSNDRILTATGTDAMNAEANLTFSDSNNYLTVHEAGASTGSHLRLATDNSDFIFSASGASNQLSIYDVNATANSLVMDSAGKITLRDSLKIPVGKSVFFGGSEHTYIREDIDDRLRFFVGGAEMFRLNEINDFASFFTDVAMAPTDKLYFDGGSDTYIDEPGGDQLRLVAGGAEAIKFYGGGAVDMYGGSTTSRSINIGANRSGNGYSWIDLVGDATYTNYGVRFIRNNGGPNTSSEIIHRGTGVLSLNAYDAGSVRFYTSNTERVRVDSSGNVSIGNFAPSYKLDVSGDIRASGDLRASDDIILDVNANYLYSRDASGTLTRMFGMNSSNTTYIGPIDAYAGGRMYYGVNANMSGHNFYTGGTLRMKLDGYVLDLPNTGDWSYILNNTNSGGLRFGSKDAGGTLAYQIELSNTGNYVKLNENTTVTGNLTTTAHLVLPYGEINDAGTDLNIVGTNAVTLQSSAGTALTIPNASTNVGIGTNSPSALLDVGDRIHLQSDGVLKWGASANAGNLTWDTGVAIVGSQSGIDLDLRAASGQNILFKVSSSEKMRLDSSGNVGIGVTSPDSPLHIGNNVATSAGFDSFADYQILLHDTGNSTTSYGMGIRANTFMFNSDVDFEWRSDNSAKMFLDGANGRLGIGTVSPGEKLEVNGSIALSNNTYFKARNSVGALVPLFRLNSSNHIEIINGNSTNGDIIFKDASDTNMTIKGDTGNVGIGITNPASLLTVNGTARFNTATGSDPFWITRAGNTNESLRIYVDDSSAVFQTFQDETTGDRGNFVFVMDSDSTAYTDFRHGSATKMRIKSDGNVGIGIVSPQQKLHIFQTEGGVGAKHATIRLGGYLTVGAEIAAYRHTGNSNDQGLIFSTYHNTNGTTDTMTLDSLGNVGIGVTSPAYKLDVVGDAKISSGSLGVGVNPNATDGRGDFSNDVVAFSTSDKRLKENIKPLDSALDKVLKINGVEFDWKELTEEEKKTIHGNEGHDVGVIAQEVEEVLPEVVTTRDSGYKAVKYEKLVPLLIESIKELKEEINGLKTKLGE